MVEWFTDKGYWVVIAVAAAVLLFFILRRLTPWMVSKMVPDALKDPKERPESKRRFEKTIGLAIALVGGIILALALAAFICTFYGVNLGPTLRTVGDWLLNHGVPLLIIILVALFIYKILGIVMPLIVMRYVTAKSQRRRTKGYLRQRSKTLGRVVTQGFGIFIIVIVAFVILSELGVDIAPLLASAGVAGIVIGLAAQDAVRDFINGFTIMAEDHYNIDDVIKVADLTGTVEEMGLRRTVIRDLKGILHVIPNGEIRVSSNYTRSLSRAFFEVDVAYKEDLDQVMEVVRRVWEEMAADPEWESKIISKTPWLLRVEDFGDSGITIRSVADTRPMQQWSVLGEMRRRIKRTFDAEDIEIPWPHVKLYMGEEEKNEVPPAKPKRSPIRRTPRPPKAAPRGGGEGAEGAEDGGY